MVKLFGSEITPRGSNRKYVELDDLDNLFTILLTKSIGQFAKETGIPYNSIRHRVHKYFTQEMIDKIRRERRFHTKKAGKLDGSSNGTD
jgi:hypothetical protein